MIHCRGVLLHPSVLWRGLGALTHPASFRMCAVQLAVPWVLPLPSLHCLDLGQNGSVVPSYVFHPQLCCWVVWPCVHVALIISVMI